MRLKIAKWGNSAGIRLPQSLLSALQVEAGSEVDAWIEDGNLIMRRVPPVTSHNIEDLLAQIDMDNIPEMEDWPAVGHEIIHDDFSR